MIKFSLMHTDHRVFNNFRPGAFDPTLLSGRIINHAREQRSKHEREIMTARQPTQIATLTMRSMRVVALLSLICVPRGAEAQTIVSPTITTATWTPAGNPYVIANNSTVPAGHTLTIQPGVVVWVGENLTVTVNGAIHAIGTPSQRIKIQSPVASQYWNELAVTHSAGITNRFKFCDFQNASNAAIKLVVSGGSTMVAEIMNCTFSNCISQAIYGQATGTASTANSHHAYLNPVIKNCLFSNSGVALRVKMQGTLAGKIGRGYANFALIGNLFVNVTNHAVLLDTGSYPGGGSPEVINNSFINCGFGVSSQEPYDAKVQNNIFDSSGIAVKTSGSLSRAVSYNGFFANGTNFSGYPATYGQVIVQNRNGTACDLLFNIFQDPLFVGGGDYRLTELSPCIDAGETSNPNYGDMCFDVSRGTGISDLGAYGGADACNWMDPVPLLTTSPWMTCADNKPTINWDAIPRSTYRIHYVTNATDTNWKTLADFIAVAKRSSKDMTSTNSEHYFRIQSLGRMPGN